MLQRTNPVSSTLFAQTTALLPNLSTKQHSTSTMDFVHSFPSVVSLSSTSPELPPARPARAELRTLFVASAIPMIGFGFMDQFVLIQAGGYIDATLGVSLGLATMTAAAAGMFLRLLYAVACTLQ
jgi:Transmembrane protein 65